MRELSGTSPRRINKKPRQDGPCRHFTIAPEGRRTTHEYDPMNHLIKTTLPDGRIERTLYSSTGLHYATIDKSGARTEKAFDATGEPIEKKKE